MTEREGWPDLPACRFLAVYAAVRVDPERFAGRFLKLTCLLASVSLLLFCFVQAAGPERALALFSRLYTLPNRKEWLGPGCGLFLVGYNFMDPARNAYLFGEPGEYQSLISAALYLLTFEENGLPEKKKARYLAVFLVTLLTIQSTVGLVNLAVYGAATLLAKKGPAPPEGRGGRRRWTGPAGGLAAGGLAGGLCPAFWGVQGPAGPEAPQLNPKSNPGKVNHLLETLDTGNIRSSSFRFGKACVYSF